MTSLPTPRVLWHTLRHLQPRQVRYQMGKRLVSRRSPVPVVFDWRPVSPKIVWRKKTDRVFFDGQNTFTFNNEQRVFNGNWNEPSARKLWLYNLHYMHWLFDLDKEGETWIGKWIKENPFDSSNAGWDPYPTSLRLFNWIKFYNMFGKVPGPEVLASMEFHTGYLLNNLEFHLGGNHLLENLLALTLAGHFMDPANPESTATGKKIQSLLERELSEQFLSDGGHYELSPMYHAILLERILDLINLWPDQDQRPVPEIYFKGTKTKLEILALSALDWLDAMTVNGRFALFNDSAYDAAPDADRLLAYGRELLNRDPVASSIPAEHRSSDPAYGQEPLTSLKVLKEPRSRSKLRALKDSGYYRADNGPFNLIFDGGKLGPDHQMGHAQGDMLSFCLWVNGQPIIVHPGNYEYIPGEMRDYCRSTASHNTLTLEGVEQADWWASHRVGWRGRTFDLEAGHGEAHEQEANEDSVKDRKAIDGMGKNEIHIRGSHDAYTRLPGKPVHTRTIRLTENGLAVKDELSTKVDRKCRIFFHFHPDCELRREGNALVIRFAGGSLKMQSDRSISLEDSWYCPEFGLRIKNTAAVVESVNSGATTRFEWGA